MDSFQLCFQRYFDAADTILPTILSQFFYHKFIVSVQKYVPYHGSEYQEQPIIKEGRVAKSGLSLPSNAPCDFVASPLSKRGGSRGSSIPPSGSEMRKTIAIAKIRGPKRQRGFVAHSFSNLTAHMLTSGALESGPTTGPTSSLKGLPG